MKSYITTASRSLKELRKKFLQSGALKKKCCLSESSSEFISFSVTAKKFSSSFGEHASFATFLTLRKVGADLIAVLIFWYFSIKRKVHRKDSFCCSQFLSFKRIEG